MAVPWVGFKLRDGAGAGRVLRGSGPGASGMEPRGAAAGPTLAAGEAAAA